MRRLNAHGIPWTLLSVITLEAMRAPRAYTDFVRSTGCHSLGFKVEESNVAHTSALTGLAEVERLYGEFVQHVWNEFPEDGPVWVREFAEYRRARRRPNRRAIPVTVTPLRNLTVGVNGEFTNSPASCFSVEIPGLCSAMCLTARCWTR